MITENEKKYVRVRATEICEFCMIRCRNSDLPVGILYCRECKAQCPLSPSAKEIEDALAFTGLVLKILATPNYRGGAVRYDCLIREAYLQAEYVMGN